MKRALTFLATAALLLVGLTVAVPAQAADPITTSTVLTVEDGDSRLGRVVLTAEVTSPSGTPTGTVTFSDGEQSATVAVDASGKATLVGKTGLKWVNTFTATFKGTNGYANSSDSVTKANSNAIIWDPEPTLLRLGPGLKVTLTFATLVHDRDGRPLAGQQVGFSLLGKIPSIYDDKPKGGLPVCEAVADANGLATCKGQVSALVGSVLSLLTGAYATQMNGGWALDQFTKLPVIRVG
jgi:hypothetical protein